MSSTVIIRHEQQLFTLNNYSILKCVCQICEFMSISCSSVRLSDLVKISVFRFNYSYTGSTKSVIYFRYEILQYSDIQNITSKRSSCVNYVQYYVCVEDMTFENKTRRLSNCLLQLSIRDQMVSNNEQNPCNVHKTHVVLRNNRRDRTT